MVRRRLACASEVSALYGTQAPRLRLRVLSVFPPYFLLLFLGFGTGSSLQVAFTNPER